MSVLVASDLDRTLIYSPKARAGLGPDDTAAVCAEIDAGRPASYMTALAAERLAALTVATTVVPVTTRILEQYKRVTLPGRAPRYAVVANGGVLLEDGEVDAAWTKAVRAGLTDAFPLSGVWEQVGHVCRAEFTTKVRNAAELFCYAVVHPNRLPSGFLADISGWAAERGWRTSLQGRKLYWVPESLTKIAAVREVARRGGSGFVLAAGDSLLDVDLLLGADRAIHPRHGELWEQGWSAPTVGRTDTSGIRAGEEIVTWFAATVAELSR